MVVGREGGVVGAAAGATPVDVEGAVAVELDRRVETETRCGNPRRDALARARGRRAARA